MLCYLELVGWVDCSRWRQGRACDGGGLRLEAGVRVCKVCRCVKVCRYQGMEGLMVGSIR